jgi:CRP/FNR family transcriptional regulator
MMETSEFQVLGEEDREKLNQVKHSLEFNKGEVIFHQGEECNGMYCIRSGTVALRKTDENGNSVLVSLIHSGQTLGIRSYFAKTDYQASAEALTPVTVCHIPPRLLDDLISRNPQLNLQFLRHISLDLDEARKTILTNTSMPVRARMAHLLISLSERYRISDEKGEEDGCLKIVLELPMNRHDMAELLATRPETVARTISALSRDGVVRFSGRTATIPDFDLLCSEAEGSP